MSEIPKRFENRSDNVWYTNKSNFDNLFTTEKVPKINEWIQQWKKSLSDNIDFSEIDELGYCLSLMVTLQKKKNQYKFRNLIITY